METRMGEEKALTLQRQLGFPNASVVKAEGLSGGLLLMWRRDVVVEELSKSMSHIDILLTCDRLKVVQWRLTGFYGEPRRERRKNSWHLMRFLRAQSASPWLCVGDFNEVMQAEEHFGVREREQWQMMAFQEMMHDCHLTDLGYRGLPYTWDNFQEGERNVKARLDRAFGDEKFLTSMGDTDVLHIPVAESDHCALLISLKDKGLGPGAQRRRMKPFRYENMWKMHADYMRFINHSWDPGDGSLEGVAASLNNLQASLRSWDRDTFGSVKKKIKQLREELEKEREATLFRGPTAHERSLVHEMAEMLAREETMERQRSRIAWLKEGDRNTEFFQAKAKARGRTNRIKALKNSAGQIITEREELEQLACDFYQQLFTARRS
jgi:hypothetical protein